MISSGVPFEGTHHPSDPAPHRRYLSVLGWILICSISLVHVRCHITCRTRSHFGSRICSGSDFGWRVASVCPGTHEDVALLILLLEMGWWSSQQNWNACNASAFYSWWTEQQWQCGVCSGWTGEAKKKCSDVVANAHGHSSLSYLSMMENMERISWDPEAWKYDSSWNS